MYIIIHVRVCSLFFVLSIVWIVEPPQPIFGITGQQATLYCRAEGMEKIFYKWLKVSKNKSVPVKNSDSESGVLVLTLEGDTWGEYKCQAENIHNHVSSEPVSVRFGLQNTKSKNCMQNKYDLEFIFVVQSKIMITIIVHTCM